jgi:hypothetical protein
VVATVLAISAGAGSSAAGSSAAFVPFIVGSPPRGPECDSAYPTICLPSPPPDLDCPQIPYTDFAVLPPDPHGLDTDKDGIGCESALSASPAFSSWLSWGQ